MSLRSILLGVMIALTSADSPRRLEARTWGRAVAPVRDGLLEATQVDEEEEPRERREDDVAAPPRRTTTSAPPPPAPPAASASDVKASLGRAIDELPMCRAKGGAGPGVARVTAHPDGLVEVRLSAPHAGTAAGACIARRFQRLAVPFDGEVLEMRIPFVL